jgi:hypothetical protein
MYPFKTCRIVILSERGLRDMVSKCIGRSNWFAVDPLPDNEWELVMKLENASWLYRAASFIVPSNEWRNE